MSYSRRFEFYRFCANCKVFLETSTGKWVEKSKKILNDDTYNFLALIFKYKNSRLSSY